MATQIQIQRSTHATNTPELQYGELGYSTKATANPSTTVGGGYLWIGDNNSPASGANLRVVGGDHYVRMMNHTLGELVASSAILTDTNSKVNCLLTTNITVGGTNLTFGQPADIIIPSGSTTAFDIQDGTNTYMSINSSTDTINFGKPITGAICFIDSTNAALTFTDASGAAYLEFDSSGNKVCVAQALDIGCNALSMSGTITGGSGTFCQAAATVTVQNTEVENTTEGGRETQLIFADNSGNEMARIRGEHDGTTDDAKGNLKLYTGSGSTNTGTADATEALEITSAQKSIFKGAVDIGTSGTAQNLTVFGNFDVKGTTTTIDSTTVTVDDKNIELAAIDVPTDNTASGGGITLKGATDKTITWDLTNTAWDFNQKVNLSADTLDYRIADVSVLTCDTLGGNVVNSSLTNVGTLTALTVSGATNLNGGLAMDNNKFTVANDTGNTLIAGTLDVTGATNLNNGTDATSATTGALIVDGGVGIAKNAHIAGTLDVTGAVNLNNVTDATSSTTGALIVDGGLGVAKNAHVGGTFDVTGVVNLNSVVQSTSSTTGALKVDGGLGVAKNAHVGGTLDVTGAVNLNDTTSSTSSTTGALKVDGGLGVAENANVGGTLDVTGVASFGTDITLFHAVNDENPTFSMGSTAANALKIESCYTDSAQTLDAVKFDTASTLAGLNVGTLQFWTDGAKKFTIQDGGLLGHYIETGEGETEYINPTNSAICSKKPYLDSFTVDGGTWS